MASILSLVILIPLNFLYDIVKSAFLIVTKSGSDTTSQCSVTAELKYAILQWVNKDPANTFTCMHERHLGSARMCTRKNAWQSWCVSSKWSYIF